MNKPWCPPTEDSFWVPIHTGSNRGKATTRRAKTHNSRAKRYVRRHGEHWPRVVTGYIGTIGGVRMVEPFCKEGLDGITLAHA